MKLVNEGYDTVTDPQRIWTDVRRGRDAGFLTSRAEITRDSFSSSAPVLDVFGAVIASLTITLPLARLTDELEDPAVATVRKGAAMISAGLGYADA